MSVIILFAPSFPALYKSSVLPVSLSSLNIISVCTCLQRSLLSPCSVKLKCLKEVPRLLVPRSWLPCVHRDRRLDQATDDFSWGRAVGVAAGRFEVGEICGGVSRDLQPDELERAASPQLIPCREPPHTSPTAPTACPTPRIPPASEAAPSSSALSRRPQLSPDHGLLRSQARYPRFPSATESPALQSPCWFRPALQSPCWFRPALQSPCWFRPAPQSPCWFRPAPQSTCWFRPAPQSTSWFCPAPQSP